jgi:hypothetical protein
MRQLLMQALEVSQPPPLVLIPRAPARRRRPRLAA